MTSQEQQWLDEFLQRLASAQGVAKDPQADALIRERLAAQPDATYLLVQRALLLEKALHDARQQIAQLQQQASGQSSSSFLGQGLDNQFGRNPVPPAAPSPAYAASPSYPAAPPAQQPGWRERLFGSPAAAPSAPAAAGSSFLGNAAASAAGVAGGMFLFNGIENLLGHHGAGGSWLGGGNSPQSVENVTQNFYDDGQNQGGGIDQLARDSGSDSSLLGGSDDVDNGSFFDDSDDSFA